MSVQAQIEHKIRTALKLVFLDVINESHMHNVPPNAETHFKVIIISPEFEKLGRVQRHQRINGIIADELAGPVHALSMETYTTSEWKARGSTHMESPECRGGSKANA